MSKLEGKTAIVTGGAGGIGKAVGTLFIAEGANVLLVDRDEKALQVAAADISSNRVATCVADVRTTKRWCARLSNGSAVSTY